MKKSSVLINLFYQALLCIFFVFVLINCCAYLNCYAISKRMPLNFEQEFLRIKIYGASDSFDGNTVSGSFSIIDSNGNEIAVIERSWSGSYLAVEFAQCNISGNVYFFPQRIYGKNHINENLIDRQKGTDLEKYYDENAQCLLLGHGSTYEERRQLYRLARFSTKKLPVLNFGTINTYTIDLSPCKVGVFYSIKRNNYGNLVIEEL